MLRSRRQWGETGARGREPDQSSAGKGRRPSDQADKRLHRLAIPHGSNTTRATNYTCPALPSPSLVSPSIDKLTAAPAVDPASLLPPAPFSAPPTDEARQRFLQIQALAMRNAQMNKSANSGPGIPDMANLSPAELQATLQRHQLAAMQKARDAQSKPSRIWTGNVTWQMSDPKNSSTKIGGCVDYPAYGRNRRQSVCECYRQLSSRGHDDPPVAA